MAQQQMSFEIAADEPPLMAEGEIRNAGEWQVRNFRGFQQAREGRSGRWRFYVCGFVPTSSGVAGSCTVLRADGTKESVKIDARDRILVAGQWYGRGHWNH
ncbi:hypothetical protein LJR066_006708 [Acidovorax sp. LjRoot66]|uniref:hypothetical protein n=1 Tax=Acidovorax sp. LjRoot66 TaxID=3342334 RepID=UPI003ECD3C08